MASGVASWLLHHQRLVLWRRVCFHPPAAGSNMLMLLPPASPSSSHLLQCCYHRKRLVLVLLALVLNNHRLVLVMLAAPPQQQVEVQCVVDALGVAHLLQCCHRLAAGVAHLLQCSYLPKQLVHCWVHNWRCCYYRQRLVLRSHVRGSQTFASRVDSIHP